MEQTLPFLDILVLSFSAVLAGFLLLVKGGEWTVDSAVYVAHKLKISPLLIGFTVIAFGTSLPELVVAINANLKGFPGITVGSIAGSNISNILAGVGLAALTGTIVFKKDKNTIQDLVMLAGSSLFFAFLVQQDVISSVVGGGMFAVLVLYVFWQYKQALKNKEEAAVDQEDMKQFSSFKMASLFLVLGLVTIAIGAEVLVRGAVIGATALGVSELVIGMTIVAFGTSLPEIVTCVIAGLKGKSDIVIGNVVGSSVFNILSIVGLTALISPISLELVAPRLAAVDVWVMLAVTFLFIVYLLLFRRIRKLEGILMIIAYAVFIFDQYFSALG